jgi:nucleotide-binding universal stress UspA family protein
LPLVQSTLEDLSLSTQDAEAPNMFRKLLLPLNLTDKHGQALDVAARMAKQNKGEIILIHVIEVIEGLSLDEERAFYSRIEKNAHASLQRAGEHLTEQGVPWSEEVLYGNRCAEVVRYAAGAGIDLIVLSSPRLDVNAPGPDWGSLSYKIGLLCQCPVLLVK